MSPESIYLVFVVISMVLIFYFNYQYRNSSYLSIVNALLFIESITLIFFFPKLPFFFSFFICLASLLLLYINEVNYFSVDNSKENIFPPLLLKQFSIFGLIIIVSVIIYEWLGSKEFGTTSLLFFILGSLFFFYQRLNDIFSTKECDFILIFLFLLSFLFFFPEILYKILVGSIGDNVQFSIVDEESLTYVFLGKPLSSFLSILGFNAAASGKYIIYEDLTTSTTKTLEIAKSCAGITSMQVFTSALFSYLVVERRRIDSFLFSSLVIGLFLCYIANQLRMSIVIIVGHYRGIDALLFTHEYLGWILFTFWMFLFWIVLSKILHNVK